MMIRPGFTAVLTMVFELFLLVIVGVAVYFKLLDSSLFAAAVGVVIRGGISVVPQLNAIESNTAATRENTIVTANGTEAKNGSGTNGITNTNGGNTA